MADRSASNMIEHIVVRHSQATCSLADHSKVMLSALADNRSRNAVTLPWHEWRPSCESNFFTLSVS